MSDSIINYFTKGTWNVGDDENIPKDAAQSSYNWITQDGRIKLINGRKLIGNIGIAGKITALHFGYKTDGTKVLYRKISTKIQYLNVDTWTDVITGLTADADYTFSNYSSLAGAFTFATGVDGIYKLINANPGSYVSLYDAARNFKGYSMIDKGRMFLWNRPEDKTGLYGSWIDRQNSTVYTTVTGEAIAAVESGTLAFKAGGAKRSCFGVVITDTSSGEVFTDNYLGVLVGSAGHAGTINYASGVFTITGQSGAGTATYRWEDSTVKGIADFTLSATRVAGEGFQFPQDVGGDAILNVNLGLDGAYYSMKSNSVYRLYIDAADTSAGTTNDVFRREIGLPFFRATTSMSKGIVFMNTSNPSNPELTILKRNEVGTDVEPYPLFQHFDFTNYDFSDCSIDTYDRYIVIACKKQGSLVNDVVLLGDVTSGIIEETNYSGRMFARTGDDLYIGSSYSESVYQIYDGFDDDGVYIENEWVSKGEQYEALGIQESLKKIKKLRLKGNIDPDQKVQVLISYDNDDYRLVGTILGDGVYVDYSNPQSIGNNMIGTEQIGGADSDFSYPFFMEIKLASPKFRKRTIKLKSIGIGYVDIDTMMDRDILIFEKRIPKRFRQKQNVGTDGITI
jgi:hypothetical protein